MQIENQCGASSLKPDGRLEIRTDQGYEAFKKAMDFWFPSSEDQMPTINVISIHEADVRTCEMLLYTLPKLRGQPPQKLPDGVKIWECNAFVDGEEVGGYIHAKEKPSKSDVSFAFYGMWLRFDSQEP